MTGKKKGGGSQILDWTYARGGLPFRCVLCAKGEIGGGGGGGGECVCN